MFVDCKCVEYISVNYELFISFVGTKEAVSDSRRSVRMLFSACFLNPTFLIFFFIYLCFFFPLERCAHPVPILTQSSIYLKEIEMVLFLARLFK